MTDNSQGTKRCNPTTERVSNLEEIFRLKAEKEQKRPRLLFQVPPFAPPTDVCFACKKEDPPEFAICDGCNAEYHLQCERVEDSEEGEPWFCQRCRGSSAQLQDYLDKHAHIQESFRNTTDIIQYLWKQQSGTQKSGTQQANIAVDWQNSEIHQLTSMHKSLLSNAEDSRKPASSQLHAYWLGKVVRLQIDKGVFHHGRIISHRITNKVDRQQHQNPTYEYLTRFSKGTDGRNETIYSWIILEHHNLSIGTQVVRVAMHRPAIAQICTRSWLAVLDDKRRRKEASALDDKLMVITLDNRNIMHVRKTQINPWSHQMITSKVDKYIHAMVLAECAEEQDAILWSQMRNNVSPEQPQLPPSADETSLEPLAAEPIEGDCPLIPRGLDRLKILHALYGSNASELIQERCIGLQCARIPVNVTAYMQERQLRRSSSYQ